MSISRFGVELWKCYVSRKNKRNVLWSTSYNLPYKQGQDHARLHTNKFVTNVQSSNNQSSRSQNQVHLSASQLTYLWKGAKGNSFVFSPAWWNNAILDSFSIVCHTSKKTKNLFHINHSIYHPTCHESKPELFEVHLRVLISALAPGTTLHNTTHAMYIVSHCNSIYAENLPLPLSAQAHLWSYFPRV